MTVQHSCVTMKLLTCVDVLCSKYDKGVMVSD